MTVYRPSPTGALALLVSLLLAASCVEEPTLPERLPLRPVVERTEGGLELVRPGPISAGPKAGTLVLIEEGRRTLTTIDRRGRVLARRDVVPAVLPPGLAARPSLYLGRSLAPDLDGYWTVAEGLGPCFVPIDQTAPARFLGAGPGGRAPRDGEAVEAVDLSDARGLLVDGDGNLLVAVDDRLFRLVAGRLVQLAGGGEPGLAEDGPASELALGFGPIVGLATGPDGAIYLADRATGKIWRITPDGLAESVAGGGDLRTQPIESMPAGEIDLDLYESYLLWDDEAGELMLLTGDVLHWIDVEHDGGPTIRAAPDLVRLASGLARLDGVPVVSTFEGYLYTLAEGRRLLLGSAETANPVVLGWAAALEPVGQSALIVSDAGQRALSVQVPGQGTFLLSRAFSPRARPFFPLAADSAGDIYHIDSFGLTYRDVNGTPRRIGTRLPPPFLDGQRVDEVLLPMEGRLRVGPRGALFLLDQGRQLLVSIAIGSGEVTLAAGSVTGGGIPRIEREMASGQIRLVAPNALAVAGDLVLVADEVDGLGGLLHAYNAGQSSARLAGLEVSPGQVRRLGGGGPDAVSDGAAFGEVGVARVLAAAPVDGGALAVALAGESAEVLALVDETGHLTLIPIEADDEAPAPDVLARLPMADEAAGPALMLGWSDRREVAAVNLSDASLELFGVAVPAGEAVTVRELPAPLVDLAATDAAVLALAADGGVYRLDPTGTERIADAGEGASSVALADDGGAYALVDGALWGADVSGSAAFMGVPLPDEGGVIVDAISGWPPNRPLMTVPFDTNITALGLGADRALYWTDHVEQGLFRARPTEAGHVDAESIVELVSRGEPVPATPEAVVLDVADEGVFLGTADRVYRLTEGRWSVFCGGGDAQLAPGVDAREAGFSEISGIDRHAAGLLVRSREGLALVSWDGRVAALADALASDLHDGIALTYRDSVAVVDGAVTVVINGSVYRVVGWPP